MVCQQRTEFEVIEELLSKRENELIIVKENYELYENKVTALYELVNLNKHKNFSRLRTEFTKLFNRLSRDNRIKVTKAYLIYTYFKMVNEKKIEPLGVFRRLLQKKPVRTMSGVNSFAVLLSPSPAYTDGEGKKVAQTFSCEHNCYYCPDQTIANGANVDIARSYLADEPAVARGFAENWDPIAQVRNRLDTLIVHGHPIDKLEYIIEGGTYTEFPPDYLEEFNRDLYYVANTYFDVSPKREKFALSKEMRINITSKIKVIGICIETRPDALLDDNNKYGDKYFWLRFFRRNGITRVQLGLQHTDPYILKKCNRGHTFQDSVDAAVLLINNGFKLDCHVMPDLPYATPKKDRLMLKTVMESGLWDGIKIYPYAAVPWSVYKKQLDSGKISLYSENNMEELFDVIKYGLKIIPYWMRCARTQRDIPSTYISYGNDTTNTRSIIEEEVEKEGVVLNEIRSREIGRNSDYDINDGCYFQDKYISDAGINYFISYESKDRRALFGFIRLFIPKDNHSPVFSMLKNKGLIRELHVYGNVVTVGKDDPDAVQHKGLGKNLIHKAEQRAWLDECNGTVVISGEGVRGYYYKLGYRDHSTYVVKNFNVLYKHYTYIICFMYFVEIIAIVIFI